MFHDAASSATLPSSKTLKAPRQCRHTHASNTSNASCNIIMCRFLEIVPTVNIKDSRMAKRYIELEAIGLRLSSVLSQDLPLGST